MSTQYIELSRIQSRQYNTPLSTPLLDEVLSKEKLKAKGHEVEYQWGRSGGEVVATGGSGGEAVTIHNVQQWNQYLL